MTTYAVDELQRAARALQAGEFRPSGPRARPTQPWSPSGRTIIVAGAHRRSGTTTVALSLAHALHEAPRLVEAGPMHTSGLAAASNAELGEAERGGWRRSTRGEVLIERSTSDPAHPLDAAHPADTDRGITVLDTGWDLITIADTEGWLSTATRTCPLLVVTAATVPGLRALELTLQTLDTSPHLTSSWSASTASGGREPSVRQPLPAPSRICGDRTGCTPSPLTATCSAAASPPNLCPRHSPTQLSRSSAG